MASPRRAVARLPLDPFLLALSATVGPGLLLPDTGAAVHLVNGAAYVVVFGQCYLFHHGCGLRRWQVSRPAPQGRSYINHPTAVAHVRAKEVVKQLRIEHSAHLSREAKLVKLADKICNLRDILAAPPADWLFERKAEYFIWIWAERVVAGLRGSNSSLDIVFEFLSACHSEII